MASAAAAAHGGGEQPFLPALVAAARVVNEEGAEVTTAAFASLMDVVVRVHGLLCGLILQRCTSQLTTEGEVRIFDHMGTVLHVAKHEMVIKTASVHTAAAQHTYLRDVVEADKAAGRATVKDSCTRNLHRLITVVKFLRLILEQLASNSAITVKEATSKAYTESLAPLHIYVVRTAVWAGMYMLPSREHFIKEIGETEESARQLSLAFLEYCKDVEHQVLKLFAGINMPVSQPSNNILASIWGGSTAPAPATTTAGPVGTVAAASVVEAPGGGAVVSATASTV